MEPGTGAMLPAPGCKNYTAPGAMRQEQEPCSPLLGAKLHQHEPVLQGKYVMKLTI